MSGKVTAKSNLKATPVQGHGVSAAFDQWLTRKLHDVFDAVAQEPLPRELRELVQKLEEKERASDPEAQFELPLTDSKA